MSELIHNNTNKAFWDWFPEAPLSTLSDDKITKNFKLEFPTDLVLYRGYFSPQMSSSVVSGCSEVAEIIRLLHSEGVRRIVVGHTPSDFAYEKCNGQLLAADSSLSRHFRQYANLYCPISGGTKGFCSSKPLQFCEGSISRIEKKQADQWSDHFTILYHNKDDDSMINNFNDNLSRSQTKDDQTHYSIGTGYTFLFYLCAFFVCSNVLQVIFVKLFMKKRKRKTNKVSIL